MDLCIIQLFEHGFLRRSINNMVRLLIRITCNSFIMMSKADPLDPI